MPGTTKKTKKHRAKSISKPNKNITKSTAKKQTITHQNKHTKNKWLCDSIKFRYNELSGGTKIIQIHHYDKPDLAIEVYIPYGSAMETSNKKGISHLVEHLIFRMNTRLGKLTLKDFLKENGIYSNAYTDHKHIIFYLNGSSNFENLNRMLYVLNQRLLNCVFTKNELDIERDIVIQELYKGLDEPNSYKWKLIDGHYYKNHPLGETIIGTVETLKTITIDDVNELYSREFIPSKFVVYIYGNIPDFETNKPVGLVNYYLNTGSGANQGTNRKLWSKSIGLVAPYSSLNKIIGETDIPEINKKLIDLKRQDKIFAPHIPPKCSEVIKFSKPELRQTHIVFLFPTFGLYNPNKHLVAAITFILRDGQKNKIYNLIRNKHGLSYVIYVENSNNVETGYLYISINVNSDKSEFAIKILKDILGAAQNPEFITNTELEIYKNAIKAEHDELKRTNAVSHFQSRIIDYREIHNIDEFYDKYYKITLDELNHEAAQLLNLDRALIYTYGG
jgi:predicted Zn-dependent peptidase